MKQPAAKQLAELTLCHVSVVPGKSYEEVRALVRGVCAGQVPEHGPTAAFSANGGTPHTSHRES